MSAYHAVLLAAGAGTRFGGRKLLAPWRGEPLVRASARLALAAPVEGCFTVLGADADLVETALGDLLGPRLRTVRAPGWSEGLSASLRTGLAALPEGSRGAVVFLADMPLVPPGAAARLIEAMEAGAAGAECVRNGAPAHPVAFGRALFPALAGLAGEQGGRRILAGRADVARVESPEPGATFDVDRPEDLEGPSEAARGAGPSRP